MADRPILFSAPMVRALIDGRKTQTRRVLTAACEYSPAYVTDGVVTARNENDREYRWPRTHAVGDRLWVRETWAVGNIYDSMAPRDINPGGKPGWCGIHYAATDGRIGIKDRASIHMPRWASRLTLVVTDVRVERLQAINLRDAQAEGCEIRQINLFGADAEGRNRIGRYAYQAIWDAINGAGTWDANPWVSVYTFRVKRENIDLLAVSA